MSKPHNLFTVSEGLTTRTISNYTRQLLESLGERLPEPVLNPVLIVVSGLPGTGKSSFSNRLAERVPVAVVESDAMRKAMVPSPLYTAEESGRLFQAIHGLIDLLLERCVPVLLDATSLVEAHREHLYQIAGRHSARVILVRVEAPPEVVRQRLEGRAKDAQGHDPSDADWEVYQRMRPSQEPIRRNHMVVDTSRDIGPAVEKIVREINRWIRRGR